MSTERRIEALERLLGNAPEGDPELERRREELKARWPGPEEMAAMEPARRRALEELGESIKRRAGRL